MKKLLALGCTVLYLHSFSQTSAVSDSGNKKSSDEKVLIKALAVIVNPESNKKAPSRQIVLSPKECPLTSYMKA
jgi:hypothetical protein